MFKVGDKVRVVEWLDMPQELQDGMSINTRCIGEVLIVEKIDIKFSGLYQLYYLKGLSVVDTGLVLFEEEIEPEIKVGQQLEFMFMEE